MTEEALREQAGRLRREAVALLERTRLPELLERAFGEVTVAGSVDFDLMVWRDIDLYAAAPAKSRGRFLGLLPEIAAACEAAGCALVKASFNDEYQRPGNPYGRGLYLGSRILDRGEVWKVDLWAWDAATYAEKVEAHRALARRLAGCDRDAILALKQAVHARPEYRDTVTSLDVYAFVAGGHGRGEAEFDAWLTERLTG